MSAPVDAVGPHRVRSLFVSDLHLGCRHSQSGPFLQFLQQLETENLYLVGDMIDGWKLSRRAYWTPEFTSVLDAIAAISGSGVAVRYAIGNHDEFLRDSPLFKRLASFGLIEVADEFIHTAADERRFLVLHGDRFDAVETGAKWVSQSASVLYGGLLKVNKTWRQLTGNRRSCRDSLSARIKRRVKRIVQHISDFEDQVVMFARSRECAGVICGHIHTPRHCALQEIEYCNTGDWVENCTAVVEHEDGRLQLLYFDAGRITWCERDREKAGGSNSETDTSAGTQAALTADAVS